MSQAPPELRPSTVCRGLLAALDASEGRRRRRKRDTTPDGIGLSIKRELLEAAVRDDPAPDRFEAWLLARALDVPASGPVRAMALALLAEWELAVESDDFRGWLEAGAPSEDAGGD
jgi:hypothetical protein